jgi:SSS family solute:Na+ symporter
MSILDWLIVGLYIIASVVVGVWFTRRASRSTEDYFIAGRSLSWFMAGTSIVATTFSSDTPLIVAGISRHSGISGHWFWLSAAMGQTATIFFFARLWRRTQAVTDVQFIAQRYEPSHQTSALRIFRVFFDGIFLNCIVMASVTLAMTKILKAMLNLPQSAVFHLPVVGDIYWSGIILFILGFSTVLYSALSGLYGVVYTELFQFILAMAGSILLAVIVYVRAVNDGSLMALFLNKAAVHKPLLSFFPTVDSSFLAMFTFFVYIFVTWWHRVPGNGYYVQRLLATRSERDSVLAFLWFNICQYVIRPWPWIIVGLLSLYYLPNLSDHEDSFPQMINIFLPAGLKGLMVVSMFAAFMSTIDTHMNWGASYIVNDFYQPFLSSKKSVKHYIITSRILTCLLMIAAMFIAAKLPGILETYKYLSVIFGGIATVMIAQWYWWRVNPWSEISAIIASLIIGNIAILIFPSSAGRDLYALRLVITVLLVAATWITVTFLTSSKVPGKHLIDFYSRMKIPGPGWKKVRVLAGIGPEKNEFIYSFAGWISCVVFIYSLTLGIGKLLFQEFLTGAICIALSILSGFLLVKVLRKMKIFGTCDHNGR